MSWDGAQYTRKVNPYSKQMLWMRTLEVVKQCPDLRRSGLTDVPRDDSLTVGGSVSFCVLHRPVAVSHASVLRDQALHFQCLGWFAWLGFVMLGGDGRVLRENGKSGGLVRASICPLK